MQSSPVHAALGRELPCPRCGYDLRATPVVETAEGLLRRCSECGFEAVGKIATSRIPWLHRRHKGAVRAYGATCWMLLRHPWEVVAEGREWLSSRDAEQFHRISLAVASGVAVASFAGAFALRGTRWRGFLDASATWLVRGEAPRAWALPVFAFTDGWWVLIPAAASIGLTFMITMRFYRLLAEAGSGGPLIRQRVRRVALYYSGILPVIATFVGVILVLAMLLGERRPWLPWGWRRYLGWLAQGMWIPLLFAYCLPTFVLVSRIGRRGWLRGLLLLLVFPYGAILIGLLVSFAVFWSLGYVAMAFWSSFGS